MQVSAKRAKMCMQRVRIPSELPFLNTNVGGWVSSEIDHCEEVRYDEIIFLSFLILLLTKTEVFF